MSIELTPRNYHPTAAVLEHDLNTMLSQHPEAFDCIVFPAKDSNNDEIIAENSPVGTLLDRDERLQDYAEPVKARAMIVPDEGQLFGTVSSGTMENFNDTQERIKLLLSIPNLRTFSLIQWLEYPTMTSVKPIERTVYVASVQPLGRTLAAAGFSYLCFPLPATGEIPAIDTEKPETDGDNETYIGVL